MGTRAMQAADARWAAEVMEARRRIYATYSPTFWRPACDVVDLHAGFLARQLAEPTNAGFRTDHAFVIGQLRSEEGFVDDYAIDQWGDWATDGRALLLTVWEALLRMGATRMRVVTAKLDVDKVAMVLAASLQLVEEWWVKELTPTAPAGTAGRVSGSCFTGILGPAPPVYDPGGPVLLAHPAPGADLEALEAEGADLGAVLGVVPASPRSELQKCLEQRSWAVASQWYVGCPQSDE